MGRHLSSGVIVKSGGVWKQARPAEKRKVNQSREENVFELARQEAFEGLFPLDVREDLLLDSGEGLGQGWIDEEDEHEYELPSTTPRLPLGSEAHLLSNAGDEYELLKSFRTRRTDPRSRSDVIQKQNESWARQQENIVKAYLKHRNLGSPKRTSQDEEEWSLLVIDFHSYGMKPFYHPHGSISINESLARHGCLGGSPENPLIAFPFSLLHAYHQIHRLPRDGALEDQFRTAFDAYLSLMREVDRQCIEALQRNTRSSYFETVCPPCVYRLEKEEPLKPTMLISLDGNNSLKLVDFDQRAGKRRPDDRVLNDPRWIEPQEVDEFKDEVMNAKRKSKERAKQKSTNSNPQANTTKTNAKFSFDPSSSELPTFDEDPDEVAWLSANENDEFLEGLDACVDRWKAAAPEVRKKMFAFFQVAGIFVAVCRHGHLLVICDMIRSSELMKYPLAAVNRLLDDFGEELGLGYDIMCKFFITMLRSEKLGAKVVAHRVRGVVPAFHGHAHNRKCQCDWHPQYVPGVGIADFKDCERTFSLSNQLAGNTRLATEFHRRQAIVDHFSFQDHEKHAASGTKLITSLMTLPLLYLMSHLFRQLHLSKLSSSHRPSFSYSTTTGRNVPRSPQDSCTNLADVGGRRKYFRQVVTEDPQSARILDYMDLLERFWKAKKTSDDAHRLFKGLQYETGLLSWPTRQSKSSSQITEVEHGIIKRWTVGGEAHSKALKALGERRYREAVHALEQVVVLRLMELTKMNMSGVGYKHYRQVQYCCQTTRSTKGCHSWAQIVDMASIADFDVLKDATINVKELVWAKPEHREMMALHFGILRANEELLQCNVEMCCLLTFMLDENADYYHSIQRTKDGNPDLAAELERRSQVRNVIHGRIAERLALTTQLQGYMGIVLFLLPD
ncbi:hypothetical protein AAF712_005097 [Marasmius tenuissimus]|uniref:Uncharacterized protein n=1 Tax=Marasmius tenuissimus TaxID=585030 RepID=A0ABR3A2W1_9AGAR